MLGFSLGLNGRRKLGGLLPETIALFARAAAEGFALPSAGCKAAINYDIAQQIASGIFGKSDRVFYLANDSGSINFGKVNAAAPLGDLGTVHGSLAFANKLGIRGNGTDAYFSTAFNPSSDLANYLLNSAHIYVSQYVVGGGRIVGQDGSGTDVTFIPNDTIGQRLNSNSNLADSANFGVTGTVGINRNNATQVQFLTGGTITTTDSNSNTVRNGDITILRDDTTYSDSGISLVRIGSGLTEIQQALINTLDAAYMVKMAAL